MSFPQSQNPPTLAITPPLAVADGGTGGASAAAARANLGVPSRTSQRFEPGVCWGRVDVADSLTDSALTVAGSTTLAATQWVARTAGSVTGISASLSAAAAGDTLTITVFKNNVATLAVATIAPAATAARPTFTVGTYTFVAGDKIDVRISTPVGWTSTTVDLLTTIEVAA